MANPIKRPIFGLRTERIRCQFTHKSASCVPRAMPISSDANIVQGLGKGNRSVCSLETAGSTFRSRCRKNAQTAIEMTAPVTRAQQNVGRVLDNAKTLASVACDYFHVIPGFFVRRDASVLFHRPWTCVISGKRQTPCAKGPVLLFQIACAAFEVFFGIVGINP